MRLFKKKKKKRGRRLSDRLREAADLLWERGDKEGADAMHQAARCEEAKRKYPAGIHRSN